MGLGQDAGHVAPEPGPQRRVQGAEGLVEKDDTRSDDQRPGQGDALLLASRELMGVATAEPSEPDELDELLRFGPLRPRDTEPDVAHDRQMGEQRTLLGYVPDAPVLGPHRPHPVVDDPTVDGHGARVDLLETGDQPQERRLPAPRRPEDGGGRPVGDDEIDMGEHRGGAEALGHAPELDRAHGARFARTCRSRSNHRPRRAPGIMARTTITSA